MTPASGKTGGIGRMRPLVTVTVVEYDFTPPGRPPIRRRDVFRTQGEGRRFYARMTAAGRNPTVIK